MTTETALSKTEDRNLFLVNPVKLTDVRRLAVLRPIHLQLSVGFHCFRESRLRLPSIVESVNFYQPICNNGPVLFYPSLILQCPLKFIGSGNDAKSDTGWIWMAFASNPGNVKKVMHTQFVYIAPQLRFSHERDQRVSEMCKPSVFCESMLEDRWQFWKCHTSGAQFSNDNNSTSAQVFK